MGYRTYRIIVSLFVFILLIVGYHFFASPEKILAQYYISPKGYLDPSTCTTYYGWTCDPDNYSQALQVDFYRDGAAGAGGVYMGSTIANTPREPAVQTLCGGYANHGFAYSPVNPPADGLTHTIYAYAINIGTAGPNFLLTNSPRSVVCAAPTPTPTPIPIPNCLNVTVPGGTLLTNTTYTISASYANGAGVVDNRAIQVVNNTCTTSYFLQFSSGGVGTVNYSWTTPNTPGTYYVQCRAWNDGIAECRGYNPCVDFPPRYLCAGPQAFVSVNIAAPTPTPTNTPTPTPTVTPTPQAWSKIYGGDVYQANVNQGKPIPPQPGNLFLNEITGQTNTVGVVQSPNGLPFSISYLSTPKWFASPITNLFSFDSYWQTFSPLAKNIVSTTVGNSSDLTSGSYVYSYTCGTPPCTFTLNTSFIGSTNLVIYLINGDLSITSNFNLPSNNVAVFVVKGSVQVGGNVDTIAGLYIVNNTFNVAIESGAPMPLSINGMILTNALSLNRAYKNTVNPTYQFTFQPQYAVKLIPYLGKSQVSWQELVP